MEGIKILVCDPIHEDGVKMMEKAGIDVIQEFTIRGSDLLEIVPDYNAIVVRSRTKVTEKVLRAGKNLKAIARAGVGLDNIDAEAAKEKGIEIVNSPEASTISVAELVFGSMLAVMRKIVQADKSTRAGKWDEQIFRQRTLRKNAWHYWIRKDWERGRNESKRLRNERPGL